MYLVGYTLKELLLELYRIVLYKSENNSVPFEDWFSKLSDTKTRAIIKARLNRIRIGNFGDVRAIGSGIYEIKINYGPGYRIYYGQHLKSIIVLICGGNKSTQSRDIEKQLNIGKSF